MSNTPAYIHGLHDPGGEHLMETRPGWIVFTEAIGADPDDLTGRDYRPWADKGFGVLVRLNHGYGRDGTIPAFDKRFDFAQRVANFAATSKGCTRWIIGNEPNHSQERPGGVPIIARDYAEVFNLCERGIRAQEATHDHEVIIPAIAPWNIETGDWLNYFAEICERVKHQADGIALHTYTHGHRVELVTSEARMGAPFQDRRFEFRAYQDFLARVPETMRRLPVYITETNQDASWLDANNGWVQAAYLEIDRWNQTAGTQKVHCLCLYRWPDYDQWGMVNKPRVHDAFRQAVDAGHRVPSTPQPQPSPALEQGGTTLTHLPAIIGGGAPGTLPPPPREWDPRLDARGVTISEAETQPGDRYWRLVAGAYLDERESQGRHHIYVDTLDEAGNRVPGVGVRFAWDGGRHIATTEAKPGELHAVDYPMYAAGHGYMCHVADGASDIVAGMGLGSIEQPHMGIHVSYRLTFQRVAVKNGQSQPDAQPPTPQPEPPAPPVDPGHIDPRVLQAILQVESGGRAFGPDGRMVIRLENHILARRVPGDWYAAHFEHGDPPHTGHLWRPSPGAPWRPMHTGQQADEWTPFLFASQFFPEAAAQSISMGAAQIMGFNHAKVGYPSARAMYEALGDRTHGEATQMIAFFAYLLNTTGMLTAIRHKDWREIARLYNGAGAVDVYAPLLEAAYRRLTGGD